MIDYNRPEATPQRLIDRPSSENLFRRDYECHAFSLAQLVQITLAPFHGGQAGDIGNADCGGHRVSGEQPLTEHWDVIEDEATRETHGGIKAYGTR
jgi:hypothetical protein